MSRYYATVTTTAGSTTLPVAALIGGTGAFIRIRQIEVFNTTATAVTLLLCRLSTAGTPGTAATSRLSNSSDTATAVGALRNTYTSTAPTTTELGRKFPLGAAIGSGIILPFEDYELTIPATAAAGIGLLVASGTGQVVETSWVWQE
jgi:hypothetical protein